MNVLIDTSVWSLAFRRRSRDLNPQEAEIVQELRELIGEGRVVHKGRSIIFAEATLSAEDGSLIATGSSTWRVIPAPKEGDTS